MIAKSKEQAQAINKQKKGNLTKKGQESQSKDRNIRYIPNAAAWRVRRPNK